MLIVYRSEIRLEIPNPCLLRTRERDHTEHSPSCGLVKPINCQNQCSVQACKHTRTHTHTHTHTHANAHAHTHHTQCELAFVRICVDRNRTQWCVQKIEQNDTTVSQFVNSHFQSLPFKLFYIFMIHIYSTYNNRQS